MAKGTKGKKRKVEESKEATYCGSRPKRLNTNLPAALASSSILVNYSDSDLSVKDQPKGGQNKRSGQSTSKNVESGTNKVVEVTVETDSGDAPGARGGRRRVLRATYVHLEKSCTHRASQRRLRAGGQLHQRHIRTDRRRTDHFPVAWRNASVGIWLDLSGRAADSRRGNPL